MKAVTGLFVLVHSPLVGPVIWWPVADELRRRGHGALVPVLPQSVPGEAPVWRQQAEAVARAVDGAGARYGRILVG